MLDQGADRAPQVLDVLAAEAGLSRGTLHKIATIQERGTEEQAERCRRGESTVNREYKELRKAERLAYHPAAAKSCAAAFSR